MKLAYVFSSNGPPQNKYWSTMFINNRPMMTRPNPNTLKAIPRTLNGEGAT